MYHLKYVAFDSVALTDQHTLENIIVSALSSTYSWDKRIRNGEARIFLDILILFHCECVSLNRCHSLVCVTGRLGIRCKRNVNPLPLLFQSHLLLGSNKTKIPLGKDSEGRPSIQYPASDSTASQGDKMLNVTKAGPLKAKKNCFFLASLK